MPAPGACPYCPTLPEQLRPWGHNTGTEWGPAERRQRRAWLLPRVHARAGGHGAAHVSIWGRTAEAVQENRHQAKLITAYA